MKIEIEVSDVSLFADALNNALAVYGYIVYSILNGCEIPEKFERLKDIPFEKNEKRYKCLKDVYKQIERK